MTAVTVSIVSHGHGGEVAALLGQLADRCSALTRQVVLTLNVPEHELEAAVRARGWPFILTIVRNARPKGYGANHNAAFRVSTQPYFCVLNPDVEIAVDPFPALLAACIAGEGAIAYPRQLTRNGRETDFARLVPTPADLFRRHVSRTAFQSPAVPDFVTGACMFFDARAFRALHGFDERYFMYCEDVDLCLRARLAGIGLARAPADVVHEAHHASRTRLTPMIWHIRSLLRLWASPAFRAYWRKYKT